MTKTLYEKMKYIIKDAVVILVVNMKKTKVMISKSDYLHLQQSGKYPCSVCCKGVGINSIFCKFCKHWVHKKCSGVRCKLGNAEDYKCKICLAESLTIDNDNLVF